MQIRPTNNIQTTQTVNLNTRNTTTQTSNALPADQLDISAEAQMLSSTQNDRTSVRIGSPIFVLKRAAAIMKRQRSWTRQLLDCWMSSHKPVPESRSVQAILTNVY